MNLQSDRTLDSGGGENSDRRSRTRELLRLAIEGT